MPSTIAKREENNFFTVVDFLKSKKKRNICKASKAKKYYKKMKKITQPTTKSICEKDMPSNFIYLTLFPQLFHTYFQTSMAQKAQQKGYLNYYVYNIRD